ncbi:hypothetical protein ACH4GK_37820 [Streptomyces rimosus]|uniref:hypothetical protein n=1 Tax=Streptomyces rimosus TaxID=1927 RepID=UPI0004C9D7D9|nr:hypothetical protein [Streptomyces rimosus]
MYLVHLTVVPLGDAPLPAGIKKILKATAPTALEHISVHSQARSHQVIGLFLRATSLKEAETVAEQVWERAAAVCPQLTEWSLLRAEVPLLPYDLE